MSYNDLIEILAQRNRSLVIIQDYCLQYASAIMDKTVSTLFFPQPKELPFRQQQRLLGEMASARAIDLEDEINILEQKKAELQKQLQLKERRIADLNSQISKSPTSQPTLANLSRGYPENDRNSSVAESSRIIRQKNEKIKELIDRNQTFSKSLKQHMMEQQQQIMVHLVEQQQQIMKEQQKMMERVKLQMKEQQQRKMEEQRMMKPFKSMKEHMMSQFRRMKEMFREAILSILREGDQVLRRRDSIPKELLNSMKENSVSKRESTEKKNSRSQWTQSQQENTKNEHLEGNSHEILMGQRSEDRDNLPSRQYTQFRFDLSSNKKEECDQNELADNFAKMTDIFRQIQKCTRPLLVINKKLKFQIDENLIQSASLRMSQYWQLKFQKKSQRLMRIKDQNYSFISEPQFHNYISRIKAGHQQFVGSLNNNVFLGETVKRQIEFVIEQRMMGISNLEELSKQLISSIDKHNGLIKGGKREGG